MSARTYAVLALLLTSIIWGVAGPVIKLTLPFLPPFTFIFFRLIIASWIFLPLFLREHKKHPIDERDFPHLFLAGLFGITLNLGLLFLGLEKTSAIEGGLIGATTPILLLLAGWWFLKEKINRKEKIGTILALLGTLFIVFEPVFRGELFDHTFSPDRTTGNLLVLLGNLAWVAYTILSKEISKKYSALMITFVSIIIGLITFLPLSLMEVFVFHKIPVFNPTSVIGLLYMSILSLGVAYFLFEWGLRKLEACETGVFAYLQPVFTFPAAYLILGELTPTLLWPGIIITALGVIIATAGMYHRQGKKMASLPIHRPKIALRRRAHRKKALK
ncbi:MAG: DMT family transporter [Patescibacteria group bacterium]